MIEAKKEESKGEKNGEIKTGQRKGQHKKEEIRQAKMVEVGAEGRERGSAMEREKWREREGPGGGAEHHVIVPWKSWAAQRKREKSERHRESEIEREETRAGQF